MRKRGLKMNKDDYIKSLENVLIFMCNTYTNINDELLKLAQEGNNAFLKVPLIQGTFNIVQISQIGEMELQEPIYDLREIKKEILRKRSGS